MGFLGIGTWEILLILILALIILGPGKLTEFAKTLGKIVRAIKKASNDLTIAVTRELDVTQDEPPPAQLKNGTEEAKSAASKATTNSQNDQATKSGGASATHE